LYEGRGCVPGKAVFSTKKGKKTTGGRGHGSQKKKIVANPRNFGGRRERGKEGVGETGKGGVTALAGW